MRMASERASDLVQGQAIMERDEQGRSSVEVKEGRGYGLSACLAVMTKEAIESCLPGW